MRVVSPVAFGVLVAMGACRREPPPSSRPGEIVPLDPVGLARLRAAAADAGRPRQPALRVLALDATIAEEDRARATPEALTAFRAALVRRLEELGAWSPRAESTPTGARLSFALGRGTLPSIVREQLERPGRVAFVAQVNCPKFSEMPTVLGVTWVASGEEHMLPTVAPSADGVARIAPLLTTFRMVALPPTLRWLHSARRGTDGTISRVGTCGRVDHLNAPATSEMRATLDPRTLAPMLDATIEGTVVPAFLAWQQSVMRDPNTNPRVVLTVDGEVMGDASIEVSDAGPVRIKVIPESALGSVSPELVGALWRSGPIELPFTVTERTAPTTATQ